MTAPELLFVDYVGMFEHAELELLVELEAADLTGRYCVFIGETFFAGAFTTPGEAIDQAEAVYHGRNGEERVIVVDQFAAGALVWDSEDVH